MGPAPPALTNVAVLHGSYVWSYPAVSLRNGPDHVLAQLVQPHAKACEAVHLQTNQRGTNEASSREDVHCRHRAHDPVKPGQSWEVWVWSSTAADSQEPSQRCLQPERNPPPGPPQTKYLDHHLYYSHVTEVKLLCLFHFQPGIYLDLEVICLTSLGFFSSVTFLLFFLWASKAAGSTAYRHSVHFPYSAHNFFLLHRTHTQTQKVFFNKKLSKDANRPPWRPHTHYNQTFLWSHKTKLNNFLCYVFVISCFLATISMF